MDGNYSLNVTNGIYTLSIKYVGYKDIVVNNVKSGKADVILNFELESDAQALGEVSVVARKNLEANVPCKWNAGKRHSPSKTSAQKR